uniref:Single-pass membrane protein with coiled-coil domains 1 n=1 Tax=Cebus imitator TaxID=2715852 RepID=A0A2K5S9M8_CEBIM
MNSETTTLISLKEAMKRVDHKLQALEAQFRELDFTKDNLMQKFEHHRKTLASQAAQDEMWTAVLALIRDITFLITNMVKNQALQDSLLRAVQVIEKGKAVKTPEEQKSSLKELIPSVKN